MTNNDANIGWGDREEVANEEAGGARPATQFRTDRTAVTRKAKERPGR